MFAPFSKTGWKDINEDVHVLFNRKGKKGVTDRTHLQHRTNLDVDVNEWRWLFVKGFESQFSRLTLVGLTVIRQPQQVTNSDRTEHTTKIRGVATESLPRVFWPPCLEVDLWGHLKMSIIWDHSQYYDKGKSINSGKRRTLTWKTEFWETNSTSIP